MCVTLVECTHASFRIFGPVDRTLVDRLSCGRAGQHPLVSPGMRSEAKALGLWSHWAWFGIDRVIPEGQEW